MTKTLLKYSHLLLPIALAACGSSGSNNDDSSGATTLNIGGAGVKGPLVNASVNVYTLDTTAANFQGELIAEGTTNQSAQITDLTIPSDAALPLIVEFVSTAETMDITTSTAPIISTMRTVLTDMNNISDVYATPLTTLAFELAISNADVNDGVYSGDIDGNVSTAEFSAALPIAAAQVVSTVGFGMPADIDIFSSAPVVDGSDSQDLGDVAAYRTAVEALSAVLANMAADAQTNNSSSTATAETMLSGLAADLGDGVIDSMAPVDGGGTTAVATFADVSNVTDQITTDPTTLTIPGTTIQINAIESELIAETSTLLPESTVDTSALETGGAANFTPEAGTTIPDSDQDSVDDGNDNCPLDTNTDQLDTEGDGQGDVCDADDDNDNVDDINDAFPLDSTESTDTDNDGTGNNADTDDDGDGVADTSDAFPLDSTESVDTDNDGTGNNADTDDDGDGVADTIDDFPLDPEETTDTDGDSVGDNADLDDDNDTISDDEDNCPRDANTNQADSDGDGIGDVCDNGSVGNAVWDQFNWDNANWQ